MKHDIVVSLRALAVLTVLTGALYPLVMTIVAMTCFPAQARGSLVAGPRGIVGSTLIGQHFRSERYFWPRPSTVGYDPMPSGASNLGPTSAALRDSIARRRTRFASAHGLPAETDIPGDMLTASGSGVDPHISPGSALLQVARIARARGWDATARARIIDLVEHSVEQPQLGFLGEPRINVLHLNLALVALDGN